MAPLIGITTYAFEPEKGFRSPREYTDAIRRAGGIPVLCSPGEDRVEELLGRLDGMLLAGGGDINPELYGGDSHEMIYSVDDERDRTELKLARELVERQIPTFAICRGIQLINVALGGSLVEHIPDEYGEEILHRIPPREGAEHSVSLDASSTLANWIGEAEFPVVSWHHQALRKIGEGLRVVGRAADGVVEAAEMTDHRCLVCVQWHPELSAERDTLQQRLFDRFVDTVRRNAIRWDNKGVRPL